MKKLKADELLDVLKNSSVLTASSGRMARGSSALFLTPYFEEIKNLQQSGIKISMIYRLFKEQKIIPERMTLSTFRHWFAQACKNPDKSLAMASKANSLIPDLQRNYESRGRLNTCLLPLAEQIIKMQGTGMSVKMIYQYLIQNKMISSKISYSGFSNWLRKFNKEFNEREKTGI